MALLAIATEDDAVWALSAWEQAIGRLRAQGHEVIGLWAFEAKLGPHTGARIPRWYIRHLGLHNVVKLGAFALLHGLARRLRGRPATLKELARCGGMYFQRGATPNDMAFVQWVKRQKVDVLMITLGHILQPPLLEAPLAGIVNKHAGALPANRGLWPYVWAVVRGQPQGVTYHAVDAEVDGGPILWQQTPFPAAYCSSMIRFYAEVYRQFGEVMPVAVERLLRKEFVPPSLPKEDPVGLPDKAVLMEFYEKGGVIVRWRDVWLGWRLVP